MLGKDIPCFSPLYVFLPSFMVLEENSESILSINGIRTPSKLFLVCWVRHKIKFFQNWNADHKIVLDEALIPWIIPTTLSCDQFYSHDCVSDLLSLVTLSKLFNFQWSL